MDQVTEKDHAEEMVPATPVEDLELDVALVKFFNTVELSGTDHAGLVVLASALAKLFEPDGTLTACHVLEAVADCWLERREFG